MDLFASMYISCRQASSPLSSSRIVAPGSRSIIILDRVLSLPLLSRYKRPAQLYAMSVIAVAGGTGGVGRAIVDALNGTGKFEVVVLSRKACFMPPSDLTP